MKPLFLIDTHTGGEPTRVVFNDGAFLPDGVNDDAIEIRRRLSQEADWIRRSILLEPRGSESMVGALVTLDNSGASSNDSLKASIVFFNNTGYLGMCGHGLIGVVEAMRYRGDLAPGEHRFATPAGVIVATLHDDNLVSFENVPSYRYRKNVRVRINVPASDSSGGVRLADEVVGDIAYGGNWFFLVKVDSVQANHLASLMRYSLAIKSALQRDEITGADGAEIDHIELCQTYDDDPLGGKTFVLCPGGHYDRSPCGTGTAAKVACLVDDGELSLRQTWTQESIIGSRFTATHRIVDGQTRVTITGRAFVNGETRCVFHNEDPFRFGIGSPPEAYDR